MFRRLAGMAGQPSGLRLAVRLTSAFVGISVALLVAGCGGSSFRARPAVCKLKAQQAIARDLGISPGVPPATGTVGAGALRFLVPEQPSADGDERRPAADGDRDMAGGWTRRGGGAGSIRDRALPRARARTCQHQRLPLTTRSRSTACRPSSAGLRRLRLEASIVALVVCESASGARCWCSRKAPTSGGASSVTAFCGSSHIGRTAYSPR